MRFVTLISDFGTYYPAVMKAVILRRAPEATIIDVTHEISVQNVREGAFVLRETVKYFPRGSVHVAVVDPGVGTNRKALVIEANGRYLVGPDNGLLLPAARLLGNFEVLHAEVKAKSKTFHGRDIFAPIAAQLLMGRLSGLEPVPTYVEFELTAPLWSEHDVSGIVVYIDHYGNCVTNIPGETVLQRSNYGSSYLLNGATLIKFAQTYDEVTTGRPLLTIGSFESIEIAVNKGNAARALNLRTGDFVTLAKV